ncbi:MAG TPA: hypothetical protein VMB50_08005 [Myxococcales bacterium]|nr:hypothetical protein [Myxococcales bacterium]
MVIETAVAFAFSLASTAGSSCQTPNGACTEVSRRLSGDDLAAFQGDCTQQKGTYADGPCPQAARLGSCALKARSGPSKGKAFAMVFYPPATQVNALTTCSLSGGKYRQSGPPSKDPVTVGAKIVLEGHAKPYDAIYRRLVAALGKPAQAETNMVTWYALDDQGACKTFLIGKDGKHAIFYSPSDAKPTDCQGK